MSEEKKVEKPQLDQNDLKLHEILIKQQELLLKQHEALSKEKEKQEEEVNIVKVISGWFKKKEKSPDQTKNDQVEEASGVKGYVESSKDFLKSSKANLLDIGFSWKGIKRLGNLISFSFWKGFRISFIFGCLGLALGLFGFFYIPPTYRSVLVLSSGTMPTTYYSGLIQTLDDLVEEKSFKELGKKLRITEGEAELITKISYQDYLFIEEVESENDSTIKVTDRPFFKIYVEIKDNNVLANLQPGLFDYIANNKFLKNRREIKKTILNNNVRKIESELAIMDSLKVAIIEKVKADEVIDNSYFVRESGINGGIILSEDKKLDVDPMETFVRSRGMFRDQQDALRALLMLENEMDIVEDFSEYGKPTFPRLKHVAMLAIAFGLLGSLVSLVLTVRDIRSGKIA